MASARGNLSDSDYKIEIGGTLWKETPPPPESKTILRLFRSPEIQGGYQGTLSIRREPEANSSNLKKSVKQWTKEFPRFGYEVIRSEEFEQNGETAQVFDLLHKETQKQVRQVVFFNSKDSLIFTCTNHRQYFSATGAQCDLVVRSFRWVR